MGKVREEDREFGSGLMDDFDGWITSVKFAANPEYEAIAGTSTPMLTLTLEGAELSQPVNQGWNTGGARNWQITRGGKEITSADKPDTHVFIRNSRAGELVAAMMTTIGGGDLAKGNKAMFDRVNNDKYMTEAEFYEGLGFHWKRVSMATVSGEPKMVLMPESYLGDKAVAKPKVPKGVVVPDDVLETVLKTADGKTMPELKAAIVKAVPKTTLNYGQVMKEIFSGAVTAQLVAEGKLIEDGDKFIKV